MLSYQPLLAALGSTSPKDQYLAYVVGLYVRKMPDFQLLAEVYFAQWPQEDGESDLEYVERCADIDFDEGAYRGAVFQHVYDALVPKDFQPSTARSRLLELTGDIVSMEVTDKGGQKSALMWLSPRPEGASAASGSKAVHLMAFRIPHDIYRNVAHSLVEGTAVKAAGRICGVRKGPGAGGSEIFHTELVAATVETAA